MNQIIFYAHEFVTPPDLYILRMKLWSIDGGSANVEKIKHC